MATTADLSFNFTLQFPTWLSLHHLLAKCLQLSCLLHHPCITKRVLSRPNRSKPNIFRKYPCVLKYDPLRYLRYSSYIVIATKRIDKQSRAQEEVTYRSWTGSGRATTRPLVSARVKRRIPTVVFPRGYSRQAYEYGRQDDQGLEETP